MGKRVFWFAIGVGLAAVVVLKGKQYYQRFTPAGVADQITRTKHSATGWLEEFFETVNESMTEREAELREATGLDG
jgi:hypothetical protein